jgi:hypothetical protein
MEERTALRVVPVPGAEYVTVVSTEPATGMISIVDVTGRLVLQEASMGNETRMNTSALPTGLYIISLTTNAGVRTAPMLIQRSVER